MIWPIPRMWEGGECWIIGGGPSIPKQFGVPEDVINKVQSGDLPMSAYSPYLSPIHGKHVIGVNAAFLLGSWIDLLFFGDGAFYWNNRDAIDSFPNIRVTCNPNVHKRVGVYNVKFLQRDGTHNAGLTRKKGFVSWNKHSGGAAISLAYHLGVQRIYLLGFDMTATEGKQHFHAHYPSAKKPKKSNQMPFKRHLETMSAISRDARALNLKIYNVNLDSVITNFPRITLEEALNHGG